MLTGRWAEGVWFVSLFWSSDTSRRWDMLDLVLYGHCNDINSCSLFWSRSVGGVQPLCFSIVRLDFFMGCYLNLVLLAVFSPLSLLFCWFQCISSPGNLLKFEWSKCLKSLWMFSVSNQTWIRVRTEPENDGFMTERDLYCKNKTKQTFLCLF